MLLVALTACQSVGDDIEQGGPLLVPAEHGYRTEFDEETVFTDGFERLILDGDEPATLVDVRLVGTDGTMELVGAKLAGDERRVGSIQVTPFWPPTDRRLGDLVPAEGAALPTGELGALLQLGIRITTSEFAYRTGVEVDYRVGDQTYRQVLPGAIANCGATQTLKECRAEFDALVAGL